MSFGLLGHRTPGHNNPVDQTGYPEQVGVIFRADRIIHLAKLPNVRSPISEQVPDDQVAPLVDPAETLDLADSRIVQGSVGRRGVYHDDGSTPGPKALPVKAVAVLAA